MKIPSSTHPALSAGFLSRLNDGELTGTELAEFEAHRAECPECSAAAAEFEAVLALYRASRARGEDSALVSRLRRKLDARLAEPARMNFLPVRLEVAWAAILVVALAAGLLLRGVGLERARRERESRVLIADRIAPLPPPAGAAAPAAPAEASNEPLRGAGKESANARKSSADSSLGAGEPAATAAPRPAASLAPVEIEDLSESGGTGSVPPMRIYSPAPDASSWAAWTKAGGTDAVVIRIDVGADGSVRAAEIETPAGHRGEDALLLGLVRRWQFRPARRDGAAAAGTVRVRLRGNAPGSY